jgi:hypothetical protein
MLCHGTIRVEITASVTQEVTVHRLTGVPVSCSHGGTQRESSKQQQQQEIDYDFSNQSYYKQLHGIQTSNGLSIR